MVLTLMTVSVTAMNIIHPGEYLPADFTRVRLIKRKVREQKQQDEDSIGMDTSSRGPGASWPQQNQNLSKSPFDDSFQVGYVLDDRR